MLASKFRKHATGYVKNEKKEEKGLLTNKKHSKIKFFTLKFEVQGIKTISHKNGNFISIKINEVM